MNSYSFDFYTGSVFLSKQFVSSLLVPTYPSANEETSVLE